MTKIRKKKTRGIPFDLPVFILFLILPLGFLACQQVENQTPVGTTAVSKRLTPEVPTTKPNPTATPTYTPTTRPTLVPTATNTAVPSPTVTPSYTPTPTDPMMIEVMRQQSYPGSEITFVETLEPGGNYDRYIISYESEGHTIFALFTEPWGDPPTGGWPVIVFNHGYIPPDEYRTTERYVDYVDAFARKGYIVLKSDYRGHGDSEGSASSSYRSPGYTADVLNALASVKRYETADPEKIGMWGHSMGGHITLRAMVVSPDIKAGVIWGGVVVSYPDLFELWGRSRPTPTPGPTPTTNPRRRFFNDWFERYGTPEENPEFWASISSNTYVADLSGPIQLHHGTADTSVPSIFSEILASEIEAAGLPVELFLHQNDNHNISINFDRAMAESVSFFDKYLK